MINEAIIKNQLFGEVGFKQSTDPDYSVVDNDNLTARSGLTFQGASNIVSIKNIKETQEYSDINSSDFNTYLKELQEECILDVIGKIIQDKSRFLETNNFYPFEQDFDALVDPQDGFIGIEIRPSLNKSHLLHISGVALSFNESITLTVYLFNSEKSTALFSENITTVAGETAYKNVDWKISLNTGVLNNGSVNKNLGGRYYLGYYESDLGTAKPFLRDFESAPIEFYSRYFWMNPYRLQLKSGNRIDPNNPGGIQDAYGLNFEYSVYKDYTDLIVKNRHLFARAIQMQMVEKVADLILNSTRGNAVESKLGDNIRNLAGFALNGNPETGAQGIRTKINREIGNLKKMLFPEPRIMKGTLS